MRDSETGSADSQEHCGDCCSLPCSRSTMPEDSGIQESRQQRVRLNRGAPLTAREAKEARNIVPGTDPAAEQEFSADEEAKPMQGEDGQAEEGHGSEVAECPTGTEAEATMAQNALQSVIIRSKANGHRQIAGDGIWWQCQWCPMSIKWSEGSSNRNDCKRTRLRKRHFEKVHPGQDHNAEEAALQKRRRPTDAGADHEPKSQTREQEHLDRAKEEIDEEKSQVRKQELSTWAREDTSEEKPRVRKQELPTWAKEETGEEKPQARKQEFPTWAKEENTEKKPQTKKQEHHGWAKAENSGKEKEGQGGEGDRAIWWKCPWCPKAVYMDEGSNRRNDCRRTEQRKKHLEGSHPDRDHSSAEAAVRRSADKEQQRMNDVKDKRIQGVKLAASQHRGPHSLTYLKGYTLECLECKWRGQPNALPTKCKSLARGGHRPSVDNYEPRGTLGDGACMWRSIAHYAGRTFSEVRRAVCDAPKGHAGQMMWNGMSYAEWIWEGRHQTWPGYTRGLAAGRIWPGALELHQCAMLEGSYIEEYVKQDDSYKRTMDFGRNARQRATAWRLEYQDGCHYELLEETQPRGRRLRAGDEQEGAGKKEEVKPRRRLRTKTKDEPRAREGKEEVKEVQEKGGETDIIILLGNVSSLRLHQDEVLDVAVRHEAHAVLLTGTSQRRGSGSAILCSTSWQQYGPQWPTTTEGQPLGTQGRRHISNAARCPSCTGPRQRLDRQSARHRVCLSHCNPLGDRKDTCHAPLHHRRLC